MPTRCPTVTLSDGTTHWLAPSPRCPDCYAPIPEAFARCTRCEDSRRFVGTILKRVVAATLFVPDDKPRWPHNIDIAALKEDGRGAVAFAEALVHVLRTEALLANPFTHVVPVPPSTPRADSGPHALARALGETLGIECVDALMLSRPVRAQKSLKRDRRAQNVAQAFEARGDYAAARILLVDDVATTCATLLEASRALAAAGAAECVGAVAGRHTSGAALRNAGHCVWVD